MRHCITVLIFIFSVSVSAKELSTKYYLTNSSSIMSVAMRNNVTWNETFDGERLQITIAGALNDFVIKRINYNFKEGAIKTFAMFPVHPDTEKIVIGLRTNAEYKLYQNPDTKRFVIELITGKANGVAPASAVQKPQQKRKAAPPVINIPQIAREQVFAQDDSHLQGLRPGRGDGHRSEDEKNHSEHKHSSALFLILSTLLILAGGSAAVALIYFKRKKLIFFPRKKIEMPHSESCRVPVQTHAVTIDESPEDLEHSIDFAEQFLRTQGELDLQARLEKLNSASHHRKIGKAITSKNTRKQERITTAQKLGVSVGELELASRLQQFQDGRHRNSKMLSTFEVETISGVTKESA